MVMSSLQRGNLSPCSRLPTTVESLTTPVPWWVWMRRSCAPSRCVKWPFPFVVKQMSASFLLFVSVSNSASLINVVKDSSLLCYWSSRFWSQQTRNCILTAEGEEWVLDDLSPRHEIQPSLLRPRNNTRRVPLPQPATPPNALIPLPPKHPRQQTATKQTSVQGSIYVFIFLSETISSCLFGCSCAIFSVRENVRMMQRVWLYSVWMAFYFPSALVPSVLFYFSFVDICDVNSNLDAGEKGERGGREKERSLSCLC